MVVFFGCVSAGQAQVAPTPAGAPGGHAGKPAGLPTASSDELMTIYSQLRTLQGSDQSGVTENTVFKRDAGTFTFQTGHLTFAGPVGGRVVAAAFTGQGTFELDPPTAMDQHQISRFTKAPKLTDSFREAVFFFTDDSWDELAKLVKARPGSDAGAATQALQAAQKKYQEHLNGWWSNLSNGAFEMNNLAARMLADLTDPSSKGLFLADIKSDHYDDLFFQISWNRDSIVMLPGEEVELIHYKHGQYSEWWSGFHLAEEYKTNPHPDHRALLAHCSEEQISAELDNSNRLSATAEMDFQVPGRTPRVLAVNLEGVLRVSALTDGTGKPWKFIQEDRNRDSDLWVILPEPAVAGKSYKMKITYAEDSTRETRIAEQMGTGLYFVRARESWFPSFGSFDDRTHFVLHFSSPKKFTFVATGREMSHKVEGNVLESDWESEIPYSVVGFNYGNFVAKTHSDPNLTLTAYAGKEVPDELKGIQYMVDNSRAAPSGPGTITGSEGGGSGILTGGFNTASGAQLAADKSFGAFKYYENYFGPLPFKTISVSEQPVGFFGQSWPTLIYLPYLSLLDTTTLNSLRLQGSGEIREFFKTVAVHEISHQWWGHMVGWKTYHDQWLSEGFAEFSAGLYIRASEPKNFKAFWDERRKWLLSKNSAGHRIVDVGPISLAYQTNSYLEGGNSRWLIYGKGAYVLEMLRTMMEDTRSPNPDGRFITMMRDFVSTYAAKNASTEDFQRVVEKHFGAPMDWFFNEWVYGTEVPHYDFSYDLKDAGDGKTLLHFTLRQSGVSETFFMKVPFYVHFQQKVMRVGFIQVKGSTAFSGDVKLPFRPEKVTIDDYHTILSTEK